MVVDNEGFLIGVENVFFFRYGSLVFFFGVLGDYFFGVLVNVFD